MTALVTPSFSTYSLPAGIDAIEATYSGDSDHKPSSASLDQVIWGTPAAIVFPSVQPGATAIYGSPFVGLYVVVTDAHSTHATTDVNGRATINARALAVGTYELQASVAGAPAPANVTCTLQKATLLFNPTNFSIAAGNTIPQLTYTVSGFQYGDKASILIGTPTETTTATKSSPPGTYPIMMGPGTLKPLANYNFGFPQGDVTIEKN